MPVATPSRTPRHPIGVVVRRTGLSADVLRAWERRYGVVSPGRSNGRQRLYSDADIQRLQLLARATAAGRGVATVVDLAPSALERLVSEDAAGGTGRAPAADEHLRAAIVAARRLAPEVLSLVLRRALLTLGVSGFLDAVVTPLMIEIGSDWHSGTIGIAHEHAASDVVDQLLARVVRDLDVPPPAPCVVLGTLLGERHGLGARIAAVSAALEQWRIVWLGTDLPAAEFVAAARQDGVQMVAVSITDGRADVRAGLTALRRGVASDVAVVAAGRRARASSPRGITVVRDLTHWREVLRSHAVLRAAAVA